MRNDILEHKDEIIEWISQNKSKAFICRQLQCKQSTLNLYLEKMNIDYAGNQSGIGIKPPNYYKSVMDYVINSTCIKSNVLKDKLIKEGLKDNKCENCGISTWLGTEIVLELHHKNGNHYDNDLDNLQILCPNCHSIQDSHKKSRSIYNKN